MYKLTKHFKNATDVNVYEFFQKEGATAQRTGKLMSVVENMIDSECIIIVLSVLLGNPIQCYMTISNKVFTKSK